MNLQQLIELAILDAMGLLDDDEQRSFESGFRAASPPVQSQVRREQTRLSRIESLLPDVTPPAGLRAAVVEAVRREMIATEAGRVVADTLTPPMIKSTTVSPFWRLASVAMAAAVIVLGVALVQQFIAFDEVTKTIQNDKFAEAITKQFQGRVADMLFNPDTQRVVIRPTAQEFKGEASIFVNPEWDSARLFFRGVKTTDGRPLRLAIVDENGKVVEELAKIYSDGELSQKPVVLKPKANVHLAIMTIDDDARILGRGELGPSI
jgi:anti-sigma-K factor RskA